MEAGSDPERLSPVMSNGSDTRLQIQGVIAGHILDVKEHYRLCLGPQPRHSPTHRSLCHPSVTDLQHFTPSEVVAVSTIADPPRIWFLGHRSSPVLIYRFWEDSFFGQPNLIIDLGKELVCQ